MEKLSGLSSKQSSNEQSLDGVYRVVVDLKVQSGQKVTLKDIKEKVGELGNVDDFFIEKYAEEVSTPSFSVGDTIQLAADVSFHKAVYVDASGDCVITDTPISEQVDDLGEWPFSLPEGSVAEVNKIKDDGTVEVLFTGSSVEIGGLNRLAYLGILELPSSSLNRYA